MTATGPIGTVVELSVADPTTLPSTPADTTFPLGAIAVRLTAPQQGARPAARREAASSVAGGAVYTVDIELESAVQLVLAYFGVDWEPFGPDGSTGIVLEGGGHVFRLTVQDGGRGDGDGVVNGVIATVVAPANSNPAPGGCFKATVPGGADAKIVGPPDSRNNLEVFLQSVNGTCSGSPRPAAQEYAFYVSASTEAQAAVKCPQVWGGPVSMGRPFSDLYENGPAGRYVCLGILPAP